MKEKILKKRTHILILAICFILFFIFVITFNSSNINASSENYYSENKTFSNGSDMSYSGVYSNSNYFEFKIEDFATSMEYIIDNEGGISNISMNAMKELNENGNTYYRKILTKSKKAPLILKVYVNNDNNITKIQMTYNYLNYDWNYSYLLTNEEYFNEFYKFLYILLSGYNNLDNDYYINMSKLYNDIKLKDYNNEIKTGKNEIKTDNAKYILEYDKKGNVTLNILPIEQ